jgi:hypothetical protein
MMERRHPRRRKRGRRRQPRKRPVDRPYHVRRLHATILHQLGLDPNRLTYFHAGLKQKLVSMVATEPITELA